MGATVTVSGKGWARWQQTRGEKQREREGEESVQHAAQVSWSEQRVATEVQKAGVGAGVGVQ